MPPGGCASQCLASDLSSSGGSPRVGGGDRIRTDDRLVANQVLYQLSYAPLGGSRMRDRGFPVEPPRDLEGSRRTGVVGLRGFEPRTSRLSGGRSNQLSYRPSVPTSPRGDCRRSLELRPHHVWHCGRKSEPPRPGGGGCRHASTYVVDLERTRGVQLIRWKGGDPAAGSPTATLLRLSPNHGAHFRRRPPEG